MSRLDDLHTLVRLLQEFELPVSPILEYSIKEKEEELMQTSTEEHTPISFEQEKPIIVSPAYSVLEVISNKAVAEYIMLWFSRKEIDRYGAFCSDASIRANLDLKRFYEFEIPLPSVEKQKAISEIYNAYIMRKEINEQLKAQIKDICPILIKGSLEEARA